MLCQAPSPLFPRPAQTLHADGQSTGAQPRPAVWHTPQGVSAFGQQVKLQREAQAWPGGRQDMSFG